MKSSKRKRIVFGIDERVPSRVAASILRNQDFELLAVHLRCDLAALGEDPATYPSAMAPSDLAAIEKFCESLGVPLKTIDVTGEVLAKVYTPFWIATLNGGRFAASAAWVREILLPHLGGIARARGADAVATGHFAKRAPDLYRYPEEEFDQSALFSRLAPAALGKLILPVGDVSTEMLMRLAREIGAIPAEEGGFSLERELRTLAALREGRGRWEWTDAQLDDPRVHARAAGEYFQPGPLGGVDEFAIGEHRGIPFHPIGAPAPGHPGYYVQSILLQSRALFIDPEAKLATGGLLLEDVNWLEPNPAGVHRRRKVRVRKEPANPRVAKLGPLEVEAAILEYPGKLAEARLAEPLYGVAPGELVVFFEESRVLGSAIVAETDRAKPAENPIEKAASPA